MSVTDTKEKGLETLIVDWLRDQNGYEQGLPNEYNKDYAIDEVRLFRFLNGKNLSNITVKNSHPS